MTLEEALSSIENDGISLGAGDFVDIEALKIAAYILRQVIEGNPVIPGHDNQYNIAEMSYNNGYAKGCEDSKPKWIPVSERLPENDMEDVLAFDGISCCFISFTKTGIYGKKYFVIGHNDVTHWMPLPNPPKTE